MYKTNLTNLDRLKLELAHKDYYTDEEYAVFLEEQGLEPIEDYNKENNQSALLYAVIAVLETLANNIDHYRSVETEFVTNTQAYTHLKNRIDELYKKISLIPDYTPTVSQFTNLYYTYED